MTRERAISLLTSVRLRWAGLRNSRTVRATAAVRQTLNQDEQYRNNEYGNAGGGNHATDYGCAHNLPCHRSRAGRCPERHAAENERKGSHQNRTQTKSCPFERSINEGFSLFVFLLGELNDKNRVLCGQTNEHHQPDLRVDIVLDLHHVSRIEDTEHGPPQPQHSKGAKYRDRRAKQHAER